MVNNRAAETHLCGRNFHVLEDRIYVQSPCHTPDSDKASIL